MLQSLGPLASPPGILLTLVLIAIILLVGRVVMNIAWRLVVLVAVAIAVLWLLGILGFQTGILGAIGV
jgi:low affinity Fe/Cu permease